MLMSLFALFVGFVFIYFGFIYWTTVAGSLPTYLPGFLADSTTIHYKHAIASFLLGLAAFAYAWFVSGKN